MSLNLVFLGPPGAGKGTIAQRLSEQYCIPQISSGDMIREEIKKGSLLGKQVKQIVDSGNLVDDATIASLVKARLQNKDTKKGFILDGFPRTIKQAELLEKILNDLGRKLGAVLDIEASKETIIERLSGRRQCKNCGRIYHIKNVPPKEEGKCDVCGAELFHREDEKPPIIEYRLKVYRDKTQPLIDYYKKKGLLKVVDANGTLQENMENAEKIIKELK